MDNKNELPMLSVDLERITGNARGVVETCAKKGVDVWGVTKGMSAAPEIARALLDGGCVGLCDSRMKNMAHLRGSGVDAKLRLIRIAMPSEVRDVVSLADSSCQSEVSTIRLLDEAAREAGKVHEVILMIDMGDLREGFWPDDLSDTAPALRGLRGGVRIVGVGANFGCASGVMPTERKLRELVEIRDMMSELLRAPMPTISIGGTCCLHTIESGICPREINEIRIGEAILLGSDVGNGRLAIPWASQDALLLTAEVVERKVKPSLPIGPIGASAFGEVRHFEDRGMRTRALIALGGQDVDVSMLTPVEHGVEIVTCSSDHTILDVTEHERAAGKKLEPGDELHFTMTYKGMLDLSTSKYVNISYDK